MKQSKKYIVLFGIFSIITLFMIIFLIDYVIKLNELNTLMILQTAMGEDWMYAEFAYLGIPHSISSFYKNKTDAFATNKTEQNVSIYFADDKFGTVGNINIISGKYDTSENNAVISYKIAISLYANRDCVGKTIMIYEKPYNIAGVYKSNDEIPFCLAQTDSSAVIINKSDYPDSVKGMTYWFIKSKPEFIPLLFTKYKNNPSVIACNTFADVQGAMFIFYCFIFIFPAAICMFLFMKFKDVIIRIILSLIGCGCIILGVYMLRRSPCRPPALRMENIIRYNNRVSLPLYEYVASWQSIYIIIVGCLFVTIFGILALSIFMQYLKKYY